MEKSLPGRYLEGKRYKLTEICDKVGDIWYKFSLVQRECFFGTNVWKSGGGGGGVHEALFMSFM